MPKSTLDHADTGPLPCSQQWFERLLCIFDEYLNLPLTEYEHINLHHWITTLSTTFGTGRGGM